MVSVRDAWLRHRDLDVIARSGTLEGQARVIDLKDYERGALGNVMDLPAPYLEALRAAEAEMSVWKAEQDNQQLEASGGTG